MFLWIQIHLSSLYVHAAAVLILFCYVVTLRFYLYCDFCENILEVRCFLACFSCCSDVWRSALEVVLLYVQYTHCAT